ncbi:hypothetical protein H7K45_02680 [Mycobacterium yunnanensis]|uniref:PE-PGRS family protein n=1 Tax=Mycobacterium yunnanensis TaxID=368477 RepID=A0A9X3BRW7_9MYCO|nr:hypothetical protein [Mycobacterium yunnanensis]MCV7419435.1 hypothetical protein [Mycobacterium yunnanensis]
MQAAIKPWFTTGVALVGASAIALTPVSPLAPARVSADVASATAAVSHEFQLTAIEWPYILSLPIVRQNIRNTIENWVVYLGGFAKAGVGLTQSLLAIPGVTVEAIQQVLALDFVGAFDTVATAVRDSVIAVGQPLLDSLIWRNQRAALVQAALSEALPLAYLSVANGFLTAANGVTTAAIVGVQDFVAAVLTLNLGNIVNAGLEGTKNFVASLGQGAGAIVAGIEAAQFGIATALATTPPPPPTFGAADVSDVSSFSTLSTGNDTLTLSRSAGVSHDPAVSESKLVAPVSDPTAGEEQPPAVDAPLEVEPEKTSDPTPVGDVSPSPDPVVKDTAEVKDTVKDTPEVKDSIKATPGVHPTGNDKAADKTGDEPAAKPAAKDDGAGASAKPASKDDGAGASAKPASGSEGE